MDAMCNPLTEPRSSGYTPPRPAVSSIVNLFPQTFTYYYSSFKRKAPQVFVIIATDE